MAPLEVVKSSNTLYTLPYCRLSQAGRNEKVPTNSSLYEKSTGVAEYSIELYYKMFG